MGKRQALLDRFYGEKWHFVKNIRKIAAVLDGEQGILQKNYGEILESVRNLRKIAVETRTNPLRPMEFYGEN
ncbi:MAG: hypothetical protein KBT11_06345 [Treponema sp.]|nr:hypothetical protein [Candidatus Treponema equifaecale]